MHFSHAVKRLREKLGVSQQEFAARLGCSIRAVATWENDRVPEVPTIIAMYKLADQTADRELSGLFWTALHNESGLTERTARRINDVNLTVGVALLGFEIFLTGLDKRLLTKEQREQIDKHRARLKDAKRDLEALDPYWVEPEKVAGQQ